jgi:uncharacterized membrane protein YpjA
VAFIFSPWVHSTIFAGNDIGVFAGLLYWYGGQLLATPWVLWPFVPDSPASTSWMLPALALILWRPPAPGDA